MKRLLFLLCVSCTPLPPEVTAYDKYCEEQCLLEYSMRCYQGKAIAFSKDPASVSCQCYIEQHGSIGIVREMIELPVPVKKEDGNR